MAAKFELGMVVATPGALAVASETYLASLLVRHEQGDYGTVCTEDKASNDRALVDGGRIMSVYPIDPSKPCAGHGDNCLWVITEADRSVTTCLLPSEY